MMDFAIAVSADGRATGRMTVDEAENGNLINNVWLSLSVRKGSFFQNPDFGLKNRGRMKNTERNAKRVEEDYKEALQWLVDTGRVPEGGIVVAAERDMTRDLNRLAIRVEVTGAGGSTVSFERYVEVL